MPGYTAGELMLEAAPAQLERRDANPGVQRDHGDNCTGV
jgi:hypothetical protein